jgi:hypothetical protein
MSPRHRLLGLLGGLIPAMVTGAVKPPPPQEPEEPRTGAEGPESAPLREPSAEEIAEFQRHVEAHTAKQKATVQTFREARRARKLLNWNKRLPRPGRGPAQKPVPVPALT